MKTTICERKSDGKWALPGGWADVGYTPTEVAAKEVFEETGYKVDYFKLLAIFDKEKHHPSPSATHVYKIFIGCEIVGGEKKTSIETEEIEFLVRMKYRIYQLLEILKSKLKKCLPT